MNRILSFFCLLCCLSVFDQATLAKEDIVLGDFEDGTYNGWSIEGDAFGEAPATGKIGKQRDVNGFKGNGLVNTFLNGDESRGTLTSPQLTIGHDFLTFLQGGGYWTNQTTIELLIDGDVVDAKVGRNSPNLEAKVFDLRRLQGKTTQVRIADRTVRGWGFVLADEFVLTDTFPEGVRMPASRELAITGKHLLIPIDNSDLELGLAPYLSVTMGDTLLYRGKVIIADSEGTISWWAHLPVPEAVGKTVRLEYSKDLNSKALDLIDTSDELRTTQRLYDEPLRPQLRFSQRFGWSNDPNGMMYYDGEYHLFFQSNPLGILWANMFWGHAVSKDLIHWEERSYALRPWGLDNMAMPPSMSGGMCFSGGGAVDFNNTLGLQNGDTKTLFVTFTAKGGGGERLAYSTNKGRNWIIPGGNLFSHNGRDPKPLWHEPSKHWVIAVYNDSEDRGGRNISFYSSTDLKNWEYQSAVPGFFECPELFELPVDDDPDNTRWVLMGANAKYLVGQFDGKTFTREHQEQKETIVGKIKTEIYAGQCFSNTPDGRVIYIGWAGMGGPDKSSPFHNGFTVPIHLTLKSSSDGPRLNAVPVKEFDQLRRGVAFHAKEETLDDSNPRISFATQVQEHDIVIKLRSPNKDGHAILRIGQTEIPINVLDDESEWKLSPREKEGGTSAIRIICDRPFMEVITGNGRRYDLVNRADRGQPLGEISLTHSQGSIQIEEFTVYRMKSIWK